MKQIKLNTDNIIKALPNSKIKFNVEPLDVNLAKIQFELSKRLEREVPEYGDFAPVTERYDNKGFYYKFTGFEMQCSNVPDSENKKLRSLDFIVKTVSNQYICNLIQGSKEEIINKISDKNLFAICKSVVEKVTDKDNIGI